MIVIFSKDRAFQLEACLRTLLACGKDVADVPVRVLWTASSPEHRQAYDVLRNSLREHDNLLFVEESNFRLDLTLILGNVAVDSWREPVVRRLQGVKAPCMWNLAQACISRLLKASRAVLFVVDDTLFLRPFRFADCVRQLSEKNDALAFSLRLGEGVTQFYMGNRAQTVPAFTPLKKESQVCQFNWADADGDFAYPLEVSSSLLKVKLILSRLLRKKWRSPNTLELALANMAGRYKATHPLLLSFREPCAVSVPLNMVQKDFIDNRAGGLECHRPEALCRLFLAGGRADLSQLQGVEHHSVHLELDLLPAT